MFATCHAYNVCDLEDIVFNGIINKNSPQVDIIETVSGVWNEYVEGEWRIVKTPFFVVLVATLDEGSHVLPFTVNIPVVGTLTTAGGDVKGVIVRPGETAVNITVPGIVQIQIFGDSARLKAQR